MTVAIDGRSRPVPVYEPGTLSPDVRSPARGAPAHPPSSAPASAKVVRRLALRPLHHRDRCQPWSLVGIPFGIRQTGGAGRRGRSPQKHRRLSCWTCCGLATTEPIAGDALTRRPPAADSGLSPAIRDPRKIFDCGCSVTRYDGLNVSA
jgi:hypothetical protein